ncbi:hypothetical protein QJS66_09635 [Kocuria rhizophila]|nr:hypothetical protein QJS66_09635 [Kocuria rhizophila]
MAIGMDMMASATTSPPRTCAGSRYLVASTTPGGPLDGIECLTDREMDAWRSEPAFDPRSESARRAEGELREVVGGVKPEFLGRGVRLDAQSVAGPRRPAGHAQQPTTHYLGFSYSTEIGTT